MYNTFLEKNLIFVIDGQALLVYDGIAMNVKDVRKGGIRMSWTARAIRGRLKLTQKDMARILDINPATYSLKENGEYGFTYHEVRKMCSLAHISLEDFEEEKSKADK